jgi:primary-amine oxidase
MRVIAREPWGGPVCWALVCCLLAAEARAGDAPPTLTGGTKVEWGGWVFRWKVLPRQGVVLTGVSYQGRSVLKYAGIGEVFVPYNVGQPRVEDLVEHPLGSGLIPLRPGRDCLPGGTCRGFDRDGKPDTRNPVVMLHEEAASLVYLGRDGRGHGKMLVLWSAYELGDYTYLVQWRFRDDGCLMPQVGLTGRLAHFGGDGRTSSEVGADQRAPAHMHNLFFCLDLDVDGTKNVVEEFEFRPTSPSRAEAHTRWKRIEKECGRELDPASFRSWRVVNPASKNRNGQPRSYELVPGGTGVFRGIRHDPDDPRVNRLEPFTQADLWVTRYRADEVLSQRSLRTTLPRAVGGESVDNEDVVLWYMMSVHHQPRSEDWPAMPADWHGFKLVPRDFLDRSPVTPAR